MATWPTSTPSRLYRGVRLEPDGRWAAYVSEGEREGHLLGYFRHEPHAALAHDRAAVFLGAPLVHGRINFPPSFSDMELLFLRRCCTEEAFFGPRRTASSLDDDYAYDMAFECFLAVEFEKYVCGDASEETARAIEAYAAREGPAWDACYPKKNHHRFVFGHISPALCSSWVELFHHGDPNRSYFTCEKAHEWQAARSRDFKRKVAAAPPAVVPPSRDDLTHTAPERGAEEPSPHSPSRDKPGLASAPWRSLERWLSSWTCFDIDNQTKDELHVPLLRSTAPVVQPKRQRPRPT